MGEYILYDRGKIVGGIYDDRLLVKAAVSLMPNASYELPYEGAKEMLLIDNVDSKEFLDDKADFILVCSYEESAENPELVIYRKR